MIKDLLKGSLEGLPFFMKPSTESQEHRHVVKNPINSDKTTFVNFGLKGIGMDMSMLLIGDDIIALKKKFKILLKKKDTLKLIHPYNGVVYVQTLRYEFKSNIEQGLRSIQLDVTFLKVESSRSYVTTKIDMVATAETVIDAATSLFTEIYSLAQQTQRVLDEASDRMTDFQQAVSGVTRKVKNGVSSALGKIQQANDQVTILLKTPEKVSKQIRDVVNQLDLISEDYTETFELQAGLLGFGDDWDIIPETTLNRIQEGNNQELLKNIVKDYSIAYLASQMVGYPFDSREEADTKRDIIVSAIDARLLEVDDFTLTRNLKTLRGEVRGYVNSVEDLVSIKELEVNQSIPSILFSFDNKDGAFHEPELLARNTFIHPAFLSGILKFKV